MTLVTINVADSFKKGAPKKIYINIEHISAFERTTFGTVPTYRIVLSTPGSATPPKAGVEHPKSYFEPFSYSVTEQQGQALLAYINTIKPITELCVDAAGNDNAPSAAASPSALGF